MDALFFLAGAAGLITSYGFWESRRHLRFLRRIPIRVHVNGARGKSSVTRLIAAGLQAGGIRTCAKTTGTLPRMIFPDGQEYPVFRPGRSNIGEQLRIVRAAADAGAEALVVECMALQPILQSISELKMIQATHGVITNIRPDHLDVMGPTVEHVAAALAGTTPVKRKLFTAERKHLDPLRYAACDRGSQLVVVDNEATGDVTSADLVGFGYIEHAENVALALKVCEDIGVDRATALAGMWRMTPDVGVLSTHRFGQLDPRNVFVNGFAANDPQSTGDNWHLAIRRFPQLARRIAVFNCRADRPQRSIQLAESCLQWEPADHYLVVGSATHMFAKRAMHLGLGRDRLTCIESAPAEKIVDELDHIADRGSLVVGMGNIGGPGMGLVRHYESQCLAN